MKKTLLALVDGSAYAESVCRHAAWIAKRADAGVKLYHVLGRREAGGQGDLSGQIKLGARTALMEELATLDEQRAKLTQAQGRAILEDAKALVEEAAPGVPVETRLRQGDIVETVTAKEEQGDLVVIGKRGEAADFARLHLGSNLERIVRAASKPIFVASRAFKPIQRVVIAYDGGPSAMKAVELVARSPLFAGLECLVVTVGADSTKVQEGLAGAKAALAAGGHVAETLVVPGQPEEALAEVVESRGADLLVMGAWGHSRIRNLIIGSTTTEMVRSCKVPVLLVK